MKLQDTLKVAVPALAIGASGCKGEFPMAPEALDRLSDYYGELVDQCVDGVGYDESLAFSHMATLVRGGYPETGLELDLLSDFSCTPVESGYVPDFSIIVRGSDDNRWVGVWDSNSETLSFQ